MKTKDLCHWHFSAVKMDKVELRRYHHFESKFIDLIMTKVRDDAGEMPEHSRHCLYKLVVKVSMFKPPVHSAISESVHLFCWHEAVTSRRKSLLNSRGLRDPPVRCPMTVYCGVNFILAVRASGTAMPLTAKSSNRHCTTTRDNSIV